jgi:hypothetical protein
MVTVAKHIHTLWLGELARFLFALSTALIIAGQASAADEMRLWTSSDGKTVSAEMVEATDTTVTIRTAQGREFVLAHERLSAADREFVASHVAGKRADYDAISWPPPSTEQPIKAAFFKKLHSLDAKRFASTYSAKILLIEGQVIDLKEDLMSSMPGLILTLETGDKVAAEFRFSKSSYDKDLTQLLGPSYNRYRGLYGEDDFRLTVADKSVVVERRYVIHRESYYTGLGNYRNRTRWSDWKAVSKPVTRGDVIKVRAEFVSVFNSVMSFKDASMIDAWQDMDRTLLR